MCVIDWVVCGDGVVVRVDPANASVPLCLEWLGFYIIVLVFGDDLFVMVMGLLGVDLVDIVVFDIGYVVELVWVYAERMGVVLFV